MQPTSTQPSSPWNGAAARTPAAVPSSLGKPPLPSQTIDDAIAAALEALAASQEEDGSWRGDYGGPLFLLPMYVATSWIIDRPLSSEHCEGIVRYLRHHQNDDGGWGLDIVSDSLVFTTSLNYVALRILGVPADDPDATRARDWLKEQGGARGSAAWGKLMLAVLNLYDYEGLHPLLPELWLLPTWLPIHPSRLWCHARMVYLPMAYLYGSKASAPVTDLTLALRDELYNEPYDSLPWKAIRGEIAATDEQIPHSGWMRLAHRAMQGMERWHSASLRQKALDHILDHIRYEDEITQYICIGPVNKLLNTLVWHFRAPHGPEVAAHAEKLPLYLWEAPDGVKMQGYNSSQLWDTAFAIQSVAEASGPETFHPVARRAFRFIEQTQVREDPPQRETYYRHAARGGWPFSTLEHGWPITDCTAEGLKACLMLRHHKEAHLAPERLHDAATLLLGMQNPDGGWATYEPTRGPRWLEKLNPSDVFCEIMIDHSHVECTSACIQSLVAYRDAFPAKDTPALAQTIQRGVDFLLAQQRDDGGWLGGWGVCFTYGTWFGVAGLRAAGLPTDHPAIQRACDFLERHQRADGGWSESTRSCFEERYIETDESQATRTAWALLALMKAGRLSSDAVQRGVDCLLQAQHNGEWPEEYISGVFNKTCAITYANYRKIFPLWALAYYRAHSPSTPS